MPRTILVVCLGNVCRSPMAAVLLNRALPDCRVTSAGLAPPVGASADPRVVRLLANEGCSLAGHRAQAVNKALVESADLVLVMESLQRETLEERFPQSRGKTFRLCEGLDLDVPDPYGCSQQMFSIVLELIKQGISSWSSQLEKEYPVAATECHREAT
ncbi:protein-tyrosine-phosphatase [Cupriavidus sp. TA19]|uniref:low molecular weight protein-tyrosine-phosphatase n=1 Tax=unclassified Cupriavidus TaxID=2640874 RepID=UPI000E2F6957|nr:MULTISPECIES: low molecular weight protein-tyrosine-phosphatase [unclassified Cupriavidus]BDB26058.1 low molecular weight phosphotyrosine protein phosphatase [Cupriavidus sp. P-10]GLC90642.1 protein-tyrosine-phosphatase [Cupriavidus sp. TA19]